MNRPCVLIGTVFYKGESIFLDKSCRDFDKKKTEKIIAGVENLVDETGCPAMIDIYLDSIETVEERIGFISDVSDMPFLIDSTDVEVRIAGARYASEVGLADKAVYNSINAAVTDTEIENLKEVSISSALVLAFNPANNTLDGRMQLLKNGSGLHQMGLLGIARDAGVKKVIIDTGITPLGEGGGSALWSIMVIKSQLGLPVGTGIHNIVSSWRWLNGKASKKIVDVSSNMLPRVLGADFVLFGPIENAESVFACAAFSECLIGEIMTEHGYSIKKGHPYSRLL